MDAASTHLWKALSTHCVTQLGDIAFPNKEIGIAPSTIVSHTFCIGECRAAGHLAWVGKACHLGMVFGTATRTTLAQLGNIAFPNKEIGITPSTVVCHAFRMREGRTAGHLAWVDKAICERLVRGAT